MADLHKLLQHYEEFHVRVEEPEPVHLDGFESESSISYKPSKSRKRKHFSLGIEPTDCKQNNSDVCAFDNAVFTYPQFDSNYSKRSSQSLSTSPKIDDNEDQVRLICNILASNMEVPPKLKYAEDTYEDDQADKPYQCTVPGCDKSYKNPNGLKYHTLHGHGLPSNDEDKPYKCTVSGCGKRYKNPNGLKYHVTHAHMKQHSQRTFIN